MLLMSLYFTVAGKYQRHLRCQDQTVYLELFDDFHQVPKRGRRDQTALNWSMDMEEELMISERVEAQDLKEYRNLMTNRLAEFREEWNELKHLRIQAENEQEQMIYLIKNEVIDLADRFDEIQVSMIKQQGMLEKLVQNQMAMMQQQQVNGSFTPLGTSHVVSANQSIDESAEESSFIVEAERIPLGPRELKLGHLILSTGFNIGTCPLDYAALAKFNQRIYGEPQIVIKSPHLLRLEIQTFTNPLFSIHNEGLGSSRPPKSALIVNSRPSSGINNVCLQCAIISPIVEAEEVKKSEIERIRRNNRKQKNTSQGASSKGGVAYLEPGSLHRGGAPIVSPNMSSLDPSFDAGTNQQTQNMGSGQSIINLVQNIKQPDSKISFRKSPFYQRQRGKVMPRMSVISRQKQMSQFSHAKEDTGGDSSDDEGERDNNQQSAESSDFDGGSQEEKKKQKKQL